MRYQSVEGSLAKRAVFTTAVWPTTVALVCALMLNAPYTAASEERKSFTRSAEIRPLPGSLNAVPVFNSNSPETVGSEGILLSTFPKQLGAAHLDYAFDGRFDVFAHHLAGSVERGRKGDVYLGLVVGNTADKPVEVQVINGASYLIRPDAPFVFLPAMTENDDGTIFAGPGDRVTGELLMSKQSTKLKRTVRLDPGEQVLLHKLSLPVSKLKGYHNGRAYMAQLQSDGPVRLALVACLSPSRRGIIRRLVALPPLSLLMRRRKLRAPADEAFIEVLRAGHLVVPREHPPSPPDQTTGPLRYGRVSGVSIGSIWQARLTDNGQPYLALPPPGKPVSYVVSSLRGGSFGTGQIQSAPLAVRYYDTAYQAHGNYGVKYDLVLPLRNTSDRRLKFQLALETPVKSNVKSDVATFFVPPLPQIYFRGTIKVTLESKDNPSTARYFHIVQHSAESGKPFVTLPLTAGAERTVHVEFFYPADCTPPQLLTLSSSLEE